MAQKDLKEDTTDKKDFKRNDMAKHASKTKVDIPDKNAKRSVRHDSSKLPRLR